jgi:hypothetical protein
MRVLYENFIDALGMRFYKEADLSGPQLGLRIFELFAASLSPYAESHKGGYPCS